MTLASPRPEGQNSAAISASSGETRIAIDSVTHEFVSLSCLGDEFIHGGGKSSGKESHDSLGWQHSEIIMFPVIGPAPEGMRDSPLGQHGLARHLPFYVAHHRADHIILEQTYAGGTPVHNEPGRSPDTMWWPHSYCLRKSLHALGSGVEVRLFVENRSAEPMEFQLGWHPAFRAPDPDNDMIVAGDRRYTVAELQSLPGSTAEHALSEATLLRADGSAVTVASGLGYIKLWSPPGSRMACIEPITDLPNEGRRCTQRLRPAEAREYRITITVKQGNK